MFNKWTINASECINDITVSLSQIFSIFSSSEITAFWLLLKSMHLMGRSYRWSLTSNGLLDRMSYSMIWVKNFTVWPLKIRKQNGKCLVFKLLANHVPVAVENISPVRLRYPRPAAGHRDILVIPQMQYQTYTYRIKIMLNMLWRIRKMCISIAVHV